MTKDEWYKIVDTFRMVAENDAISEVGCFLGYSICPMGIITPQSFQLLDVYMACKGLSRISTPAEYFGLPAIYIDAVQVIELEIKRLEGFNSGNK